jgi:hypothetical protein
MDNATKRLAFDLSVWIVSLFAVLVLIAHEAMADSSVAAASNDRWKAECGSCHIAYPPRLLPAPAWRRMMSQLDKHFGADASLDARAAAGIGAFLEQNAASGRRAQGPAETLRITETGWFRREHGKVPAATWKHAAVQSAANCGACHTLAEQGDFRERNIRIPR